MKKSTYQSPIFSLQPKKINLKLLISLCLISSIIGAASCGSRHGTLTIVNPTLEAKKISIDGKTVVVSPEQHLTQKGMKKGSHQVQIGTDAPMTVDIQKKRSTLIDLGGDNCFIVADFTDQYGESGTGTVKVLEKFMNKNVFTTSEKVTAQLSEPLPEGVGSHKTITRIHRVDCTWIDNDQAIIDAIANLP